MTTKLIYNKTKGASVAQHSAKPQLPMGADGKDYERTFSDENNVIKQRLDQAKAHYEDIKAKNSNNNDPRAELEIQGAKVEYEKRKFDWMKFKIEDEKAKELVK